MLPAPVASNVQQAGRHMVRANEQNGRPIWDLPSCAKICRRARQRLYQSPAPTLTDDFFSLEPLAYTPHL